MFLHPNLASDIWTAIGRLTRRQLPILLIVFRRLALIKCTCLSLIGGNISTLLPPFLANKYSFNQKSCPEIIAAFLNIQLHFFFLVL